MKLLVLCFLAVAAAEKVSYEGEVCVIRPPRGPGQKWFNSQVVILDRFLLLAVGPFDSEADAQALFNFLYPPSRDRKVIFWKDPRGTLPFEFVVSPDLAGNVLWYLSQNDVIYQVHTHNVQSWIEQTGPGKQSSPQALALELMGNEPTSYLDYNQTITWMNNLAAATGRVSVSTFGNSEENRLMYLMTISNGTGSKPGVWIDCGIHAREWISPATCRWIAHKLATGYGSDSDSTWILDNYNIYMAPMINPDGYQYTFDTDRLWRKTRTDRGDICIGVDPNRNYATGWDAPEGGSSDDPCSQTYRGPGPFSEPSQAAVRDKARELSNSANLRAYITIHSYGQLWIFPWAYTVEPSPDFDELERVGILTCDAIESVNGLPFEPRPPSGPVSGMSVDWGYDPLLGLDITYSYLPELRPVSAQDGGFVIDESNIQPSGREIFAGINAKLRDIINA